MPDNTQQLTPAERRARYEGYEPGDKYGSAWALTADGDLATRRGQSARVYDADRVVQDLKVTLLTPEGPDTPRSDPIRPAFGMNKFRALGEKPVSEFRNEIIRTIGPDADPRVEALDIEIDWDPGPGNRESAHASIEVTLTEFEDPSLIEFPIPAFGEDIEGL